MTTIARPGDRVEITAVQSYEATWDDTLDRLIGLTGVLTAVNDSHLRENERTGTLDCAPFEVRIDRDAEIDAGQVVFAASVRPVGPEPSEAAGEERREQYAKAVLEVKSLAGLFADVRAHVDPVMAVADAEQAELRARVAELEDKKQLADRERDELQTGLERALAPFCEDPTAAARAAAEVRHYDAAWFQRDAQRLLDRVNELEAMQTPAAAADPVPLRWGLDDIEHGDDDTTTVLLSGPDGQPYWLELDPERTAALREALTRPDTAQQP